MNAINQQVLFYVLIVFFVLIGLASLLAVLGYARAADSGFRKWAVSGFAAVVITAVVTAFKIAFTVPPPAPIVVALRPLDGTPIPKLKSAEYHYDEVGRDKVTPVTQRGYGFLVIGEGGWQVQLPGEVSNKVIQLFLRDEDGGEWQTGPFYPNYVRQEMRSGKQAAPAATTTWTLPGVAVLLAAEQAATAPVKINNYARRSANRYDRPYYDWRVFVDESPAVLNRIASVDYQLHPTFPDPFQSSRDRGKQFELQSSGWGSFTIIVTVHYTDGRQTKLTYWLDLQKPWPTAQK